MPRRKKVENLSLEEMLMKTEQEMVRLRMCNIEVLKKFYIIWCARHQILQNLEIPMYFNRDISCPWNPFSY